MNNRNYKRLGDYIEAVNVRNVDNVYGADELRGVNNEGNIMQSKANIVGVEFNTYKIAHKGYFIYNPARLDIGSLSCLQEDSAIFSQMYVVFKVKEECKDLLDTDFLWLLLKRKEFYRYVGFINFGSVREMFTYEDMCNVLLPVPSIEEQRRIVSEYQTVERRIKNNEAMIQKLEETAQAIYHHTFVEGIDENNLPEGWKITTIKEFCDYTTSGGTPDRGVNRYWSSDDYRWLKSGEVQNCVVLDTEEWISEDGLNNSSAKLIPAGTVTMAMYGATASQVAYVNCETTTNQACCNLICDDEQKSAYLYFALKAKQYSVKVLANGGAQENLNQELIVSQPIIEVKDTVIYKSFKDLLDLIISISRETSHLCTLLSLLTSKLS